jgi:hypothetical protein
MQTSRGLLARLKLTLNLSAFRETAAKGKEDLHKDAESPEDKGSDEAAGDFP